MKRVAQLTPKRGWGQTRPADSRRIILEDTREDHKSFYRQKIDSKKKKEEFYL
jgi:hypothetical protein